MSGTIMEFKPINPLTFQQQAATIAQTNAQTGLIGAQTGAVPSEIEQRMAEAAQARARASIGIPAEAAEQNARASIGIPAQAAEQTAQAGMIGANTFATNMANRKAFAVEQQTAPALGYQPTQLPQGMKPIGPETGASDIGPEMNAYLRAIQPSESPPDGGNVLNHNGQVSTFDQTQGHPGVGHAGFYQLGSAEWAAGASALGINSQDFSNGNQARVASWLAQTRYNQQTGRDLVSDLRTGQNHDGIVKFTAGVWPSVTGGSQENKTGASFATRLPMTLAHEMQANPRAPAGGVPGTDNRAVPAGAPVGTWNGIPTQNANLSPMKAGAAPIGPVVPPPAGATPPPAAVAPAPPMAAKQVYPQGSPRPFPGILANSPGAVEGTPQERTEFKSMLADNMSGIAASAANPTVAINQLWSKAYLTPEERQTLLNNPGSLQDFIMSQRPFQQQPAYTAAKDKAAADVVWTTETGKQYATEAQGAQEHLGTLEALSSLQNASGSGPLQGKAAGAAPMLAALAKAAGFGDIQAPSDWVAMQSLTQKLTAQSVHNTGNVRAVREWDILGGALPNTVDPDTAFKIKTSILAGTDEYTMQRNAAFSAARANGWNPGQFTAVWNEKADPFAFAMRRLTGPAVDEMAKGLSGDKQSFGKLLGEMRATEADPNYYTNLFSRPPQSPDAR